MTEARLLRGSARTAPREDQQRPCVSPPPIPRRPRPSLRHHGVRVVVAMAVVYLLWGSTYIAMEVSLRSIPPMLLMTIRFAIAGGVLYAWAIRRGDRRNDRPTLRQWAHTTMTGGVMLVGGTGLIGFAMVTLGAGTAALLSATVPVWFALFARLAFRDRLPVMAWVGLLLGLVGVGVIVDPAGGHLGGMVLAILGAMAWAGGSLRSRVAPAPARPLVAASMEMLGASVLFLVLAIALGEPAAMDLAQLDLAAVAGLAYLTTAGSLVAFTAYRWLLSNASTSLVGTHAYVNPVVAVLLAWLLLGERLEGRALVAAAIILVSVMLVVRARPHEPVPAQMTSGGDVFAGTPRWRRAGRHLVRVPSQTARLIRRPGEHLGRRGVGGPSFARGTRRDAGRIGRRPPERGPGPNTPRTLERDTDRTRRRTARRDVGRVARRDRDRAVRRGYVGSLPEDLPEES